MDKTPDIPAAVAAPDGAAEVDFQVTARGGALHIVLGRGVGKLLRDDDFRTGVLRGLRDGADFLCRHFNADAAEDEYTDEQYESAEKLGRLDALSEDPPRYIDALLVALHADVAAQSVAARVLSERYVEGYRAGHEQRRQQPDGADARGTVIRGDGGTGGN